MQNRQQIRDQLGALEERLEELGAFASANERESLRSSEPFRFGSELLLQDALDSMRDLSQLVYDQQLLKSIPANDFLLRICGLMVQDAHSHGVDLAISHHGEGKISMEIAELVMGAIVATFRSSLKSHRGLTRDQRLKNHLFQTGSVYLEVRANTSEVQFRLADDGHGFSPSAGGKAGGDVRFAKLRDHIAQCGGWFGHKSFAPCGGLIEFKVPLTHNRTESLVLRQGEFEVLLPSSCALEVRQNSGAARPPENTPLFRIHETEGLIAGDESSPVLLRIGVADLQFWVGCESVSGAVKVRRAPAGEFVEEGCWLRTLGLFHEDGVGRALPLLDGAALVHFHTALGDEE